MKPLKWLRKESKAEEIPKLSGKVYVFRGNNLFMIADSIKQVVSGDSFITQASTTAFYPQHEHIRLTITGSAQRIKMPGSSPESFILTIDSEFISGFLCVDSIQYSDYAQMNGNFEVTVSGFFTNVGANK